MKKKSLKANNGVIITDVVAGILILTLFIGVIGNLYYQIALHSNMIHLNAIAVYYSVKIAENIDRISYEDVTNELNNTLAEDYQIQDPFKVTINVENYNQEDSSRQDIIKLVNIRVEYQYFQRTEVYEIKKLKIREN